MGRSGWPAAADLRQPGLTVFLYQHDGTIKLFGNMPAMNSTPTFYAEADSVTRPKRLGEPPVTPTMNSWIMRESLASDSGRR